MRKKWKNERHLRDRRQSRSPDLFVRVAAGIKKLLRSNQAITNGYAAFFLA
jgi:hypothetical protein